ncbi:MAG: CRISPR-associated endonuclease Cas1 [Xenococcaceae cyanobacterium]
MKDNRGGSRKGSGNKPKWGNQPTSRITVPTAYLDRLEEYALRIQSGIDPESRILILPPEVTIQIGRELAIGYARNKRTRLMDAIDRPTATITALRTLEKSFLNNTAQQSIQSLLGYCGKVGSIYWQSFDRCFKFPGFFDEECGTASPVKICLDWLKARLEKECGEILSEVAIVPDSQGILHSKLALDLAFIFEAQICDTILINCVNRQRIGLKDFDSLTDLTRSAKTILDESFDDKLRSKAQSGCTFREIILAEAKKVLLAVKGILAYEAIVFRGR